MQSLSTYVWVLAGILLTVAIAGAYFTQQRRLAPVDAGSPPYFGKAPLTPAERELYVRLREAMPECVVLAQVALSSLVGVRERSPRTSPARPLLTLADLGMSVGHIRDCRRSPNRCATREQSRRLPQTAHMVSPNHSISVERSRRWISYPYLDNNR
jgi:hypothetical protein